MMTNVYKKWKQYRDARVNPSAYVQSYPATIKDIAGNNVSQEYFSGNIYGMIAFPSTTFTNAGSSNLSWDRSCVFLGENADAESEDDYAFTFVDDVVTTISELPTTDGEYVTITAKFTNNGASAHTLTECALIHMSQLTSGSPYQYAKFLFGRKLLTEPITLEAGASKTLTIVFKVG